MMPTKSYNSLLAVVAVIALLTFGCEKPPPPEYLFRYHFQPGQVLNYEVSIDGQGEAVLETSSRKKGLETLTLPIHFQGSFLLQARIDSVTDSGNSKISISYKDFNCIISNRVRDRITTMTLSDELMRVEEGGEVRREINIGDSDFPLNGIVGSSFAVVIDPRGKIIQAEEPPDPGKSFPYMKFDNLLEQIQP
ncbi:MAG: hypothetical protein U9N73_10655, partial [Candidatus Auribacterota bacterium]|nr:hypothetical protein [Candidatus Auribacterota bacterium]